MKTHHVIYAILLPLLILGEVSLFAKEPSKTRLKEVIGRDLFVRRFFTVCHDQVYAYLKSEMGRSTHEFIIRDLYSSDMHSVKVNHLNQVRSVRFNEDCSSLTVHLKDSELRTSLPYKILSSENSTANTEGEFLTTPLPLGENEVIYRSNAGEILRPFKNQVGRHHILHSSPNGVFVFKENLLEQSIQHYSFKERKTQNLVRFKPQTKASLFRANITSGSKTSLPGYVIQSSNSKGLVIFVHGGGCWLDDSRVDATMFSPEAFDIVHAGFDMLYVSYSGDDDPYLNLPEANHCGVDEVIDLISILGFVKSRIDPKNIFLMGESYGAYLINLMVGRFPNLPIQGAITKFGVWDMERQKSFIPHPDRFQLSSLNDPKLFIESIKAPLLLLHGQNDHAVAFANASFFLSQAKTLGLEVEALTPERMGHGFDYSTTVDLEEKLLWHQRLLDFLESRSTL